MNKILCVHKQRNNFPLGWDGFFFKTDSQWRKPVNGMDFKKPKHNRTHIGTPQIEKGMEGD